MNRIILLNFTRLQYKILVTVWLKNTTTHKKLNARDIYRFVKKSSPYPTVYENLKKLKYVSCMVGGSQQKLSLVKYIKPINKQGFWIITDEGKEVLDVENQHRSHILPSEMMVTEKTRWQPQMGISP
jgi:Fe2+ or Zn2+ uptake regulation protein